MQTFRVSAPWVLLGRKRAELMRRGLLRVTCSARLRRLAWLRLARKPRLEAKRQASLVRVTLLDEVA